MDTKENSQKNSIPVNEIINPSVLGSTAIASVMGKSQSQSVRDAARHSVESTLSKVKAGNLEDLEAILVNQVYVLNSLFNELVMQGKSCLAEPAVVRSLPNHPKTMLNTALKAQNQCRATVQAIFELKNPKKTTFIKNQLNSVQMEVEEIKEQLEDNEHGSKTLDGGAEATAIPVNSEMAALEIVNGSKDRIREGS